MRRVCANERRALNQLYDALGPGIYGYLRRLGADQEDAADLLQQVFMNTWLHRHRFLGHQASAWVYRIARNCWYDYFRCHAARAAPAIEQHADSPEQTLVAEQLADRLQGALDKLPLATREIILLSRFSSMSLTEIAAVMNTTEANVKVRLHRGLMALKACVEERDLD